MDSWNSQLVSATMKVPAAREQSGSLQNLNSVHSELKELDPSRIPLP